jgi:hypothetical protein
MEYELSPENGGTRITVTQDNNATQEEASHSEQNWNTVLGKLKELLEKQDMDSFTAEILHYLNSIKTEASLVRNIEKVIQGLSGRRPKGLSTLIRRKE